MVSKLKNVYAKFLDMEKPMLVDWLLFFSVMIFCYISYNHFDIFVTLTHGKDLVECILNGKFFEFYDYTQSTAVYQITVYLVFAVWSIPVFIVYKIMGLTMWGVLGFSEVPYLVLMWYKLLPTIFYFAIAYLVYKIVLEIKNNKNLAKWAAFMFVSSPIAMFSQFIFGQYDSIGLFFTVLSFYFFIKKKYYWFSAMASVAVTFKMFALFLFIPLLLLVEKRLIHIVKHLAIAMIGYVITTMMFRGSAGYNDAMGFSGGMIPRLFHSGIETSLGTVSLFTVAMMVICVVAFNKKIENDDEYFTYSIYISFFVYATLFMFILWHPQWLLFLIPFMTLAFFLNVETNSVLILHSAMSVGYLVNTVVAFNGNVDTHMLQYGIFPEVLPEKPYDSVMNILSMGGVLNNNPSFSLFAGALGILLFMYMPTKERVKNIAITSDLEFDVGHRGYMWLRIFTLAVFIVPVMWMYIS